MSKAAKKKPAPKTPAREGKEKGTSKKMTREHRRAHLLETIKNARNGKKN